MKTKTILTIAAIALSFGAFPVDASTCNSDGPLGVQTVETPAATFYVDDRGYLPELAADGNPGGFWVYQESNGVAGLQTGGTNVPDTLAGQNLTGGTDPCSTANPDTAII